MRFADRKAVAAPASLDALLPSGRTETQEAIDFFVTHILGQPAAPRKKGEKKKKFTFKAYRAAEVKRALESIFHGKCAYCESRYDRVHPVDVEHWRPKAEVIVDDAGKRKRYGYYWLAATWDNLLPSCIDCNRPRNHMDFLLGKRVKIGKGNWFPLIEGCERAEDASTLKQEKPLLLNPCVDRPERYLRFAEEGVVRPNPGKRTVAKADASIRIYALNREGLVRARLERIKVLKQKMKTIENFSDLRDEAEKEGRSTARLDEKIRRELAELMEYRKEDQEYSVMADQLIEDFLRTRF